MPEELGFKASIDGFDKVEAGLNAITKDLTETSNAANKLSSGPLKFVSKSLDGLTLSSDKFNAASKKTTVELAATAMQAGKVDSSLKKAATGTNTAAFALTNLGRVAQDAPFGFIGIQNNINPLLESFQRLRAETGSTKSALSALGSSLVGGAGIGLAVSVVTGLLTVLAQNGFFSASKAAEESAESFKRLKEVISETSKTLSERNAVAAAGVDDEITKVNALAAVIKNQNLSYEQRNNALLQLQSINKNYFGDITLEGEGLKKLTSRVNEYTDALIASAVVKSFSQDIGKLSVEFALQLNTLNKLNKELDKNKQILAGTKESTTSLTGEDRLSAEFVAAEKAVKKSSAAVKEQSDVIVDLSGRLRDLKSGFQRAIEESLKFRPLEDEKGETVQKVKAITEELGKLEKVLLRIDQIRFREAGRFDEFLRNVKPDSKVFNKVTVPIKVAVDLPALGKSLQDALDKIAAFNAVATAALQQLGVGIATSIGDALGEAFAGVKTGQNILGDLFSSIFKALGAGLRQLGIYAVTTSKLIIALKTSIGTTLGIAGGIALIALGTLISAAASRFSGGVQGFATGGLVGGTGNRDTVNAMLTPGEFVITKSAVQRIGVDRLEAMNKGAAPTNFAGGGIVGGSSTVIIPDVVLRGSDLILVFDRASATKSRQG